jgi:hypothetical protein
MARGNHAASPVHNFPEEAAMRLGPLLLSLLIAPPVLAQMTTAGAPNQLPPPSLGLGFPGTPPPTTPGLPPTTPGLPATTPGLPPTTPGPAGGGMLTPPPMMDVPQGSVDPSTQGGFVIVAPPPPEDVQ